MNCTKNAHHKSIISTYNTAPQAITATNTALNLLGAYAINSGIALEASAGSVSVLYGGTYEIDASIVVDATTAGDVTTGIYLNGVALPEASKTITCTAGNTEINLNAIRRIDAGCCSDSTLQVMIVGDGTVAGSVISVDMQVVKVV